MKIGQSWVIGVQVFFSCILSACLAYFIIKQTSNDKIIHRIQNVQTLRLLLQEQSCVR